jgi:hypothetical protein
MAHAGAQRGRHAAAADDREENVSGGDAFGRLPRQQARSPSRAAPVSMSSPTATDTLLLLAEEFASSSAPLQAIKCLEAAFRDDAPAPLPLTEVRARLRLAGLLVEFTDNVTAAKAHLERAVRRRWARCGRVHFGAAWRPACALAR